MLTSTQVPDPTVVELYLTEIARAYNVQWAPNLTSSSTSTPISATLGVPLPLPGMPTAAAEEPAQLAPAEIFSGEVLPADEVVLAHATGIPLVQAGQVQGDFLAQTVPEGHFAFSIDLRKDRVGGLGITLDVDGSNRVIGLTKVTHSLPGPLHPCTRPCARPSARAPDDVSKPSHLGVNSSAPAVNSRYTC